MSRICPECGEPVRKVRNNRLGHYFLCINSDCLEEWTKEQWKEIEMKKEKDNQVRLVTEKDGVRVRANARLYEAIIYNLATNEEENRSDPMEYEDAIAWGLDNKDGETYSMVEPFRRKVL